MFIPLLLVYRTVLLAIIYVLSRTENLHCPEIDVANLDLGEIREQRLAQTPPHIIECAGAKEGENGHLYGPLILVSTTIITVQKTSRIVLLIHGHSPLVMYLDLSSPGGSQEACHLPRDKRYGSLGQKGITLWMTGLSGSGKSTIASALEEELVLEYGKHVYRLDGDNIRTGLNRVRWRRGEESESEAPLRYHFSSSSFQSVNGY